MKLGVLLSFLSSFLLTATTFGNVCFRDDGDCRTFYSYSAELNQTYINGYCQLGHQQAVVFFDHGTVNGDFTYMCS